MKEYNYIQYKDYYPFGMEMANWNPNWYDNSDNRYLYNGKELQTDFDLNWYDYGARFYDPALGRWHSVDPRCEDGGQESWSPYHYVLNNPVKLTDPDGRIFGFDNLIGFAIGAAADYACQVTANFATGDDFSDAFTHDISLGSIFVSGAEGFITDGLSATSTIATSVAKSGVKEIALKIGEKAVVGATKEVSGQIIDNALKGDNLTKNLGTKAITGAIVGQLDVKANNSNAKTTLNSYGNGNAVTHRQQSMVKSAEKSIKANNAAAKVLNSSTTTTKDVIGKKIDKKDEKKQ
jgi:RHS repeat-associated protein